MTRKTVKDPICGCEIDPLRARAVGIFGGVTYYFCSADCKGKFSDPRKSQRSDGPMDGPEARTPISSPPLTDLEEAHLIRTDKVAPLPPPIGPRTRLVLLLVLLALATLLVSFGVHLTRP